MPIDEKLRAWSELVDDSDYEAAEKVSAEAGDEEARVVAYASVYGQAALLGDALNTPT